MKLVEIQIDRLVGPTHNFGGLGIGNLASQSHAGQTSKPASAAIQGLRKMRLVAQSGVPQFILPPQSRPHFSLLRSLGFDGSPQDVLSRARDEAPELLLAAMSSSAMWVANAATVTPGIDSGGDLPMISVANLNASVHRAIEPSQTISELRSLFGLTAPIDDPIIGGAMMRDEGAANHLRLANLDLSKGINLFVHGDGDPMPGLHWPRQTLAASKAIARRHRLDPEDSFFLKQHPDAIDAGAFHNDVVALSHQNLLIHHESAFYEAENTLLRLEKRFQQKCGLELNRISVSGSVLSLEDAVNTYLFNSQVISPSDHVLPSILCPVQVQRHPAAKRLVDQWCDTGIFREVKYVELDQSMSGGGGPACLRLRVPLTESHISDLRRGAWSEPLEQQLIDAIRVHYPESVTIDDLADFEFVQAAIEAQSKVSALL